MELMERELRYNEAISFRLYHLCYYFSTGNEWDEDRKRLIQFKNANEKAIRIFISQSIDILLSHRIEKELIIVRALSSKELVAEIETEQPLDRLGKGLSATFGCLYLPGALKKKHPTKPIKSLTITNRQKELACISVKNLFEFKS